MHKSLSAISVALCTTSCAGIVKPVIPPTKTTTTNETETSPPGGPVLQNQDFGTYDGPFGIADRIPAPNISTYRQDPVNALGSIFVRIAKPSMTCASAEANAFEFRRLLEERPEKCQSKTFPAATVENKFVDGRSAANIAYIVGEASVSAEYAFEFTVSEPVTASLINTSDCVIATRVQLVPLPERTCDVLYVAGVTVTQVSYRRFKKISANATASYVVKVGGETYGSSSELVNKWYMTVDPLDLSRFFGRDPDTGFLQGPKPSSPPIVPSMDRLPTRPAEHTRRILFDASL